MTDSRPLDAGNAGIDPERPRAAEPFDKDDHFTGQTYHRDAERAEGDRHRDGVSPTDRHDARDLPPDNGRRARIAADGSVHGSGVGIGGGSSGEDLDGASASDDHEPATGGDGRPEDLSPAHVRE